MRWPPRRVMIATDFSETANAALEVAGALARRTHATLDVVHAIQDATRLVTGYEVLDSFLSFADDPDRLEQAAEAKLRACATRLGEPAPEVHLVHGDAAAEIVAFRELLGCDLLVLGSQGLRGLRRFLLGSVSDRVLRQPGPPLLLVREAPRGGEEKRILVAQELPDAITPWLRLAVHMAHDLRGELLLVHVLPPRGYVSDKRHAEMHPETVEARLRKLVAQLDATIPVEVVIRQGDPTHEIAEVAREHAVELVVLGAERHEDGWPGAVADRVVRAGLPATLVIWPDPEADEDFE